MLIFFLCLCFHYTAHRFFQSLLLFEASGIKRATIFNLSSSLSISDIFMDVMEMGFLLIYYIKYFALAYPFSAVLAVENTPVSSTRSFSSTRTIVFCKTGVKSSCTSAISAGSTSVMQSGFLQHNNFGAPFMIYASGSFQKISLV